MNFLVQVRLLFLYLGQSVIQNLLLVFVIKFRDFPVNKKQRQQPTNDDDKCCCYGNAHTSVTGNGLQVEMGLDCGEIELLGHATRVCPLRISYETQLVSVVCHGLWVCRELLDDLIDSCFVK